MRKLLLTLALVAVFGVFAGCQSAEKAPEPAQNATDIATESAEPAANATAAE
ncbi:MAG: hypothetical protein IJD04_05120 [Desulfovibrionaceae bacterium]|nr:hypothetical protein [Desulfovibrionaceae bacterium]